MCADCCRINIETGKITETVHNKIEKLTDNIYIGHCGSAAVSSFCIDGLKRAYRNGIINDKYVDDTIEFIKYKYHYFIKEYPNIEKNGTTLFVIVGRLKNEELTYSLIENSNNGIYSITYNKDDNNDFLCISPSDLDVKRCIEIISKERKNSLTKDIPTALEEYMRKSIVLISKESKVVSEESIFYLYENIE